MALALLYVATAGFAGELHDAVRAQNKAAVESILSRGAAVDETDFMLGTPLHVAVSSGDREIAKMLIGHGADVEAISEQQSARAAHLAAQFGDTAMLALLIDSGADLEALDDVQRTPLLRAADAGEVEAARLLLDRGAKVNVKEGRFGRTPRHEAVFHGDLELVKLLLEYGADLHATTNSGQSPFWLAAYAQSYSAVGDSSLIEYLLGQGADPNAKDASGLSALAYADFQVRQGAVIYVEIAEELRRLGVSE